MRASPSLATAFFLLLGALGASNSAVAKDHFRVCWSDYSGALPWGYAAQQNVLARWAKKYGISIDVVRVDTSSDAAKQYAAGQFDGCTMNALEALTVPAAAGIDTTALILSDFSAGNDGVLLRGRNQRAQDLKGKTVQVQENSVAHYVLVRALESVQLSEEDVTLTPLTDEGAAFASGNGDALAISNPALAPLQAGSDRTLVFSSHRLPGEVVHLFAVNTDTLRANPALGRALTGAWFELMKRMSASDEKGAATLAAIAKSAGADLPAYQDQLSKTRSFYTPRSAVAFAESPALPAAMQRLADFAFSHHMLGKATSAQSIGVSFANGVVNGSPANIKLRFEPAFMQVAADGKL